MLSRDVVSWGLVSVSYKTPGHHIYGQRAPPALHRSSTMSAPHGTSYNPANPYVAATGYKVTLGHNASNSLNITMAGTSHQHQVPGFTAQEDTPHYKPLDNWDIAPSPLPCFTSTTRAPRSTHVHLDDIKPSSTKDARSPKQRVQVLITQEVHITYVQYLAHRHIVRALPLRTVAWLTSRPTLRLEH